METSEVLVCPLAELVRMDATWNVGRIFSCVSWDVVLECRLR